MRQNWWKFLGIALLIYTVVVGMSTPLKPGVLRIDPLTIGQNGNDSLRITHGETHKFRVKGYNTNFADNDNTAWLKLDSIGAVKANKINIVNDTEIDLTFDIPNHFPLRDTFESLTLVLNNNQLNTIDFSNNGLLESANLRNNQFSNATVAYLSSVTWIDDLYFDGTVSLPSSSDFVILLTVEAMSDFTIYTLDNFDYDYIVDWGDGSIDSNVTGDVTHNYLQAGSYEITISGDYPALQFCHDNNGCSAFKIDLLTWGSNEWKSMQGAFQGLAKFSILAEDTPNLSDVNNLSFMFYKALNFDGDISNWDISAATNMNFMFGFASNFNGDLSRWDTGNVSNMGGLFYSASSFNGDISRWDTSKVTKMHSLFAAAASFNGDLSQWNTGAVTHMATMFLGAQRFNGDVSSWDVSQVTNMEKMFYNASSMSGNLSNWPVGSQVRYKNFTHEESLLIPPNWRN